MAITTSWLIGSTYIARTEFTAGGMPADIPAGYYYLTHTTDALDLLQTLATVLVGLGIAGASVRLGADRHVRIEADAGFTLVWPAALAELFGFDADLDGTNALEVAPNISPLLWSPGKTESPQEAPLGVAGRSVYDTRFGTAPDGTQVADSHHAQVINTFTWSHVATSRFQTADNLGGEYTKFFDVVLRKAYKFFLYRHVAEDSASSADVVLYSGTGKLGPYGYRPTRGSISWDFQRSAGAERFDRWNNVSLDCLITPEWET